MAGGMAPVVPAPPGVAEGAGEQGDSKVAWGERTYQMPKKAPTIMLAGNRTIRLPFCAYRIAMRRVSHFNKIALFAAMCTLVLSGVKYYLARQGERDAALKSLKHTAISVTKALRLTMTSDLSTLDAVANVWHLDSRMSRYDFRQLILSDYFRPQLNMMETIILIHRVRGNQRDAMETEPSAVQVRTECCNTTAFDVPARGKICRNTAKNQCRIPGNRYHFVQRITREDGSKAMVPAANNSEYAVIYYQEPLEDNPGPTGLDMMSMADRIEAFWESDRTGLKGVTKRLKRFYSAVPEFGMLIWNNVFLDTTRDGEKMMLDGVQLQTKQRILDAGGEPYAVGSVVAVYRIQNLLRTVATQVFGEELMDAKLYLFDKRSKTEENERLLAMYDMRQNEEDTNSEVWENRDQPIDFFLKDENAQYNDLVVPGTEVAFSVALVPHSDYLARHTTEYPLIILGISLCLVICAQMERWMGHPIIISELTLQRSLVEQELREELEPQIAQKAADITEAEAATACGAPYVSPA
mmetsp:Transcript_3279/g.10203  ORF Transcript_3279/g.10203 Transcript_3279/m.10203 type:complete len:524 (-) Transcript_3279:33-1604(-)